MSPLSLISNPRARLRRGSLLVVGLLLAAVAISAEGQTTWYAEKYAAGDAPVRVEHLWSRGSLFRSDAVVAGHTITTIIKGDQYIIIDQLLGTGVSITRAPEAAADQAAYPRPFGNELESLIEAGGEFIKVEDFGGNQCDLYRLTDSQGRREVCATKDEPKLPVLLRVWLRQSQRRIEARYLNWSYSMAIPEAFFDPDPRIALTKISYEEYVDRAAKDLVLPAPPLYRELLHGSGER